MEQKERKNRIRHVFLCMTLIVVMLLSLSAVAFADSHKITVVYPHGEEPATTKWSVSAGAKGEKLFPYNQMTVNGQKVYCIDPASVVKNNGSYINEDLSELVNDANLRQELGYISGLGYGYGGDSSEEMDFATQIRIWQALGETIVNINPEIQAKLDQINERLAIMKKDVSFNGKKVTLNGYGKEYAATLSDSSQAFQHYRKNSADGIHMEKQGNGLRVWAEKGDKSSGTLTFDSLYESNRAQTPIAYKSTDGGQNVAVLGASAPKQAKVTYGVNTGSITLEKGDYETGNKNQGFGQLDQAKWQVTRLDTHQKVGEIIWKNGSANTITGLPLKDAAGNWIAYQIKEIEAPTGYHLGYWENGNLKNEFWITFKDIPANSAGVKLFSLQYKDSVTKTEISKVEITGEEELPGATLTVLDSDGKEIEKWVSGDKPHQILGLEVGKTYTLRETIPASGHYSATDIEFKITGDHEVEKVEMVDKPTEAYITKTDITGDKELPGAKLTVTDKESGKEVDKWTSTKEPHKITGILDVNKVYVLEEVTAPKGYKIAKSIEFSVKDDGNPVHVTMKDEAMPNGPQTGDDWNMMLYVLLAAAGLGGIGTTGFVLRKRNKCK